MTTNITPDAASALPMFRWFYDEPNPHLQLHTHDCRHTTGHLRRGLSGPHSFWTTPIAGQDDAVQLGRLLRRRLGLKAESVRICPDCLNHLREQLSLGQFTL
jgi:hypothetical protein